jgi:hypothetical protein
MPRSGIAHHKRDLERGVIYPDDESSVSFQAVPTGQRYAGPRVAL